MNDDGLLSKCVGHVATAPLPNLQRSIHYVGWAKLPHPCSRSLPASMQAKRQRAQQSRAATCWARHYRSFAQPTIKNNPATGRLGKAPACPTNRARPVGHVTTAPLPNLQRKPTLCNPCRLGKAQRAQQFHYQQTQQGFSLLEMAIVVLILSIFAAIAMPNLASTDSMKLDTAAKEVADAIRFARAEAIRTKTSCGIATDAANDRIRVYSLPSLLPVYDIYHPIEKKLYDIQLKTDAFIAGVDLSSASFSFAGSFSSSTNLGFNTDGNPKYSVPFGNDYMLTSGIITLSYQGQQRIVSIAPVTGRVTIQ